MLSVQDFELQGVDRRVKLFHVKQFPLRSNLDLGRWASYEDHAPLGMRNRDWLVPAPAL
jgi:hypothetical protein